MSLEQRAKILQAITVSTECGVRDIVLMLRMKNSNVISLLRRMEQERLIDVQLAKGIKKGRPKKRVAVTLLGNDFLDSYRELNLKRLRSTKADLDRAVKDALYARRLADRGHSTFEVFMELNAIASNIKNSS
jgi:DNA-binding PadR family transcriptional regulator